MTVPAPRHTMRVAALAWPIMVGQLALIANGVIDTAMTSRFSTVDLAALALGISIYVTIFVGLNGVLHALTPIIGQLFGAQRFEDIGFQVKQAIWLSLFLSVPGCLALLFPQPLLSLADASPALQEKVLLYLRILALALPATLGFRIYAGLNTAIARPKMVMAVQVGALLLKIPLNYLFIFGGLGMAGMGGPGAAIATTICSWLMLLLGWALLRANPFYRGLGLFNGKFFGPDRKAQRELMQLGLPVGLSYLIEVTAFTFMALFIARISETVVAGHQVIANFGTVLYMVPLSIASATSTLTAQAIGSRDLPGAKAVGDAGIRLAAIVSVTIGAAVWLSRDWIVRAYTPDPAVITVAVPLFFYIAFYQLFDSLQVSAAFVLRAYKIAIIPTVMYALSLWGLGLGGGYLLGLDPFGVVPPLISGAAGFWLANSCSLGMVAVGLLWYLRRIQRHAKVEELAA